MHVPFKIHYRNNLIDKKDSYLIPRPPSWDDRNYIYGHQLYPSGQCSIFCFFIFITDELDSVTYVWVSARGMVFNATFNNISVLS